MKKNQTQNVPLPVVIFPAHVFLYAVYNWKP